VRARVNVSVSVERERASGVDVRAKVCVWVVKHARVRSYTATQRGGEDDRAT